MSAPRFTPVTELISRSGELSVHQLVGYHTVMIVKSIYTRKVTQEHMVKHRKVKVTIVRNANTKAKTQDFWRVIERKNRRASIKMSIKNGWKKLYGSMKTCRSTFFLCFDNTCY